MLAVDAQGEMLREGKEWASLQTGLKKRMQQWQALWAFRMCIPLPKALEKKFRDWAAR